jgi:hypothetical protein
MIAAAMAGQAPTIWQARRNATAADARQRCTILLFFYCLKFCRT